MLNVNQLTSQLRMLPDAALQRMAMMYKQDPYIFPMIISEGMARKKLRAAGQAQAAQGPQPKVADQAIASMVSAPEEMGIAQLPAPNMERMADGGIAGQADDADLVGRSEPVVRMAAGGVPGYAGQERSLVSLDDFDPLAQFLSDQGLRTASGETYAERKARERRERELAIAAEAEGRPLARGLRAIESSEMTPSAATYALQKGAAALRRAMYPTQEELGVAPARATAGAQPAPAPAAPSESVLPRRTSFPSQALERAVATRPEAPPAPREKEDERIRVQAPAYASDKDLYSLDPAVLRKRAQALMPTNEYETAYNVQARKELERLEAREAERERNKPVGKAREGLEALLKKEGEGETKEMSDAGAFALIRAGLAVAGGTSPNALKNIADGLGIGLQDYQAAVKDLKKASRERKLMLADIEEARRLEAKGDYDKAEDRKDKAEDRRASIERFAFSGIQQLKLNQDQIAAGFAKAAQEGAIKRDITGMELGAAAARTEAMLAGQERVAQIQTAARSDPSSKAAQAVARVAQAINASPYLKELSKMAGLGNAAAIQKYQEEERRLYLQLAPELMIDAAAGGGGKSSARAAGDAILNKGG